MALKNSPARGRPPRLSTFPATFFLPQSSQTYITFYSAKHGDQMFCIEDRQPGNKIQAAFRRESMATVSTLGRFLVQAQCEPLLFAFKKKKKASNFADYRMLLSFLLYMLLHKPAQGFFSGEFQ